MIDLLAEEPVVLLGVVLAVGAVLGAFSIKGVSIGPAGALFAGLAASAIDERLVIPTIVGIVGLALFTYCVGLAAGPQLSKFLRPSLPVLGLVALLLGALAPVAALIGELFGISRAETAGIYAGGLTNTPALAAAQSALQPRRPRPRSGGLRARLSVRRARDAGRRDGGPALRAPAPHRRCR